MISSCFWRALLNHLKKIYQWYVEQLTSTIESRFRLSKALKLLKFVNRYLPNHFKKGYWKATHENLQSFKIATIGLFGVIFCKKLQVGEYKSNSRHRCSSYIFGFEIWQILFFCDWKFLRYLSGFAKFPLVCGSDKLPGILLGLSIFGPRTWIVRTKNAKYWKQ